MLSAIRHTDKTNDGKPDAVADRQRVKDMAYTDASRGGAEFARSTDADADTLIASFVDNIDRSPCTSRSAGRRRPMVRQNSNCTRKELSHRNHVRAGFAG